MIAASDSDDRQKLSHRAKRDDWSWCRNRGRRVHQALDTAERRRHQVTLLAQLMYHRLELRRRQMGEFVRYVASVVFRLQWSPLASVAKFCTYIMSST